MANAEDSEVTGNRIIQPAYGNVKDVGKNLGINGNYGIIHYNGSNVGMTSDPLELEG
jgi:hypothetical protein